MEPTASSANKKARPPKSLKRIIKEHNIHFHPDSDKLPSSLQCEFAAVETIDNAEYEENRRRSSPATIKRMKKVCEAVNWCLVNEYNEAKWRSEVETKIFKPLTKHHTWYG
jgi:hypothetical protein